MQTRENYRLPWYGWILAPFVFPAMLFALSLFLPFVLISIPYYALFPDHHVQLGDVKGTANQKRRLEQWRTAYRRLGMLGRIRRWAIKRSRKSVARKVALPNS